MKTALLISVINSHFVELSRLARILKASGKYKPVIWFLGNYPVILRDVEICRVEEWEYILSVSSKMANGFSLYAQLKRIILGLPKNISFWILFLGALRKGFFSNSNMIKILAQKTISFIQQYKPDILILCEENVGYATHIPIRICYEHQIPTVIVPYTIANATEAAEFFYNSFEHQVSGNFINQLVARKYPHWVYEHRGRKLLRLPAAMIILMERSGYSPLNPWVLNNEETTIVAVENDHMLDLYRHQNLADDRLIVTGALYDDVLADSTKRAEDVRSRLIAELGLQKDLPLLLCALPPSQFPRDCEFSEYETMVSYWMNTLSHVNGWNVVVRPHPRLTGEEIEHLKQFGVKIANLDTASLIPLCDLYITSVSATIRWAIACGKPVLNYDVYQMNYSDFKNVGGVLTVFSKNAFKDTINRLTTDRVYFEEIAALQIHEMSKWGHLDGKSFQRMLQLFDDVISGKIRRIEK